MSATVPSLWLARHGETAWTLSRQHTGRTDLPLTAAGEASARDELAPRLAGFPDPQVDERLREFDYGDYEGLTTAEIQRDRPDWDLWTDGCPGGETAEDVGARMDALIADRLRGVAERALLFGHGHALRILTARWVGLPPREGRVILLAPGSVGITGAEHGRAAIERWNP